MKLILNSIIIESLINIIKWKCQGSWFRFLANNFHGFLNYEEEIKLRFKNVPNLLKASHIKLYQNLFILYPSLEIIHDSWLLVYVPAAPLTHQYNQRNWLTTLWLVMACLCSCGLVAVLHPAGLGIRLLHCMHSDV